MVGLSAKTQTARVSTYIGAGTGGRAAEGSFNLRLRRGKPTSRRHDFGAGDESICRHMLINASFGVHWVRTLWILAPLDMPPFAVPVFELRNLNYKFRLPLINWLRLHQDLMPTPRFSSDNANANSAALKAMIIVNAIVRSMSVTPSRP